jgi:hypothetical protein
LSEARLAALDDYVRGTLSEAEAEAFEQRLFADACAPIARSSGEVAERTADETPSLEDVTTFLALWDGVRDLCARGTFSLILTEREARHLLSSGIKVAYFDVDAPGPAHLSLSSEILLTRFALDLTGVEQLDVELMAGEQVVKTIHDVSFDPALGAVYMACEAELAIAGSRAGVVQRFVAVPRGEGGASSPARRVLREFRQAPDAVVLED